jgi:hypothetical protein
MKKILICGDSYCVTDPKFPGLHWSEKLLNQSSEIEVSNLAYGGCSNALIVLQLLQGLKFKPDLVVLSFTNEHRYEADANINAIPFELTAESIASYIKDRYNVNPLTNINLMELSQNFEKIKSYFYIMLCLQTLKSKEINFCFSLGGFEYQQDYTALLRSNFLENTIANYSTHELSTNLWYHGTKQSPFFHVDKEEVQTLFANECFSHLNKTHA